MAFIFAMLVILLAMVLTLVVAALVVVYVAFIQRGKEIPRAVPKAEWLTDAMLRASDRWGVPTEAAENQESDRKLHVRHGGIRRPREH